MGPASSSDGGLDDLVRLSRESIAKGSQSFAAASRVFNPAIRDDVVMLYAWCRYADDLIDGQTAGHDQKADYRVGQEARLNHLTEMTRLALAGQPPDEPVFRALQHVVEKNQIPTVHPMELIDGFRMDVEQRHYSTEQDTLDYCYHVAGVVGVMMAMIMGVREPNVLDRACDLGIAFQLTNIARDVMEDAAVGRTYLPEELLQREQLAIIDPYDEASWPAIHRVALRLLDMAEVYYASANAGLSALPMRSAWAIAAARRFYGQISRKLRDGGPLVWRQRVFTTTPQKVGLMTLATIDMSASRLRYSNRRPEREGLYSRPSAPL